MTTPTPLPLDAAALDRIESGEIGVGPSIGDRLIAQSRAALTLAARVAELERIVGAVPTELPGDLGHTIAVWLSAWFKQSQAENFVSIDWRDPMTDEWFVVSATKRGAKSPATMLTEAEARAAELEEQRDGYRNGQAQVQALFDGLWKSNAALAASHNALRDALHDCFEWFDARADVDHVGDPMRPFPNAEAIQREHVLAALAAHPAASLAAHDAEVRTVIDREWATALCAEDTRVIERVTTRVLNARALAAHAQEVKPCQ